MKDGTWVINTETEFDFITEGKTKEEALEKMAKELEKDLIKLENKFNKIRNLTE
jgi:predicted RNase H-like HicB family nuclease